MHFNKVYIDAIEIPSGRLRKTNEAKVKALAESMAEIGLQHPVSFWRPDDDTCDLITGLHRFLAAQSLGWDEIDCVFVDLDDLDRQLWEIDENLCRYDLSDAERADHTAKRAEIFRQRAALAKSAKTESEPPPNADKGQTAFDKQTAAATGRSTRSVRIDKSRGEKIARIFRNLTWISRRSVLLRS